jgi:hypothetical protein
MIAGGLRWLHGVHSVRVVAKIPASRSCGAWSASTTISFAPSLPRKQRASVLAARLISRAMPGAECPIWACSIRGHGRRDTGGDHADRIPDARSRWRRPAGYVRVDRRSQDGLWMVYSFFDPNLAHRSLGTFMILDHVQAAKAKRLPYVYLGYWVRGSRKMDYKSRFRPLEALGSSGWKRLPKLPS